MNRTVAPSPAGEGWRCLAAAKGRLFSRAGEGISLVLILVLSFIAWAEEVKPFVITVVDDQTGRGVPLVELKTVNEVRFYTDSAGVVAFREPGLMNQRVFFTVSSHGYEYAKDGFGMRGSAVDVKPGGAVTLKVKRLNIAQRLYRVTGAGIYADSVLAGRAPPIEQPLLNGQVVGQDSVQRVIYKGKIHWFWGDTGRPSYPLGNFGMSGAVSDLPGGGGLDPAVGVNLKYFVNSEGFSRAMIDLPGPGVQWADGFVVIKDGAGKEVLIAKNDTRRGLEARLARYLVIYDDDRDIFKPLLKLDRDEPLCPQGHTFRHEGYVYFATPYPVLRVRADLRSVQTPAEYEGFTCLTSGARYDRDNPSLERDGAGKLVWAWKKNTPPVSHEQQDRLIKSGKIKAEEGWYRLKDADSKQAVIAHGGTVNWNEFRKRWVMIAVQVLGKPSNLGEVYYSESDKPEGPWVWAKKVVTHDRYSFYNPAHHPFFDQGGGRVIYFEGTYSYTFSRQGEPTPRYDYNQIMYRLDLSDPRLKRPD
jgi:hypothetical protein